MPLVRGLAQVVDKLICKVRPLVPGIQDSFGFWTPHGEFSILYQWNSNRIPIIRGILDFTSCIPKPTLQLFKGWIALQWITQLDFITRILWIVFYPVDSTIHLLNNRGKDSGFHKQKSAGFRNADSPTRGNTQPFFVSKG